MELAASQQAYEYDAETDSFILNTETGPVSVPYDDLYRANPVLAESAKIALQETAWLDAGIEDEVLVIRKVIEREKDGTRVPKWAILKWNEDRTMVFIVHLGQDGKPDREPAWINVDVVFGK